MFPSLLLIKPFGGHTGEGDGVIFTFALANDVVEAALATGMQTVTASRIAKTFLIAIPLELADAEKDSNRKP